MMPTFRLGDFLPALLDYVGAHPLVYVAGALVGCVVALTLARRVGVSITRRHAMDDTEPDPLRRVSLDAAARFSAGAEQRKRTR